MCRNSNSSLAPSLALCTRQVGSSDILAAYRWRTHRPGECCAPAYGTYVPLLFVFQYERARSLLAIDK